MFDCKPEARIAAAFGEASQGIQVFDSGTDHASFLWYWSWSTGKSRRSHRAATSVCRMASAEIGIQVATGLRAAPQQGLIPPRREAGQHLVGEANEYAARLATLVWLVAGKGPDGNPNLGRRPNVAPERFTPRTEGRRGDNLQPRVLLLCHAVAAGQLD